MPHPLNILMAEDNPVDAELVLRELRRAGVAPNAKRVDTEAAFLEGLQPEIDLVLSDFEMPQFDGMRALELRNRSGLDVPFILVSGTMGEDTAVEAMRCGASDYLLKDRLARLGAAVEQALDQTRLRRERRAAEERLRENFASMAAAQEVGNFGSWEIGITPAGEPDRNGVRWSAQCYRIFGFEPGEVEVVFDLFFNSAHPDDRELIRAAVLGTVTTGRPLLLDHRLVLRSGEVRHVREAGRVYRDAATARPIKLVGTVHDITEEHRAAEALRERDARLHALDRRMAEIVHGMAEACFAVDGNWNFTFVNSRGEELMNLRQSDLLGRSFWKVFARMAGQPEEEHFRRAMTDRVPRAFESCSIMTDRWLDIRVSPSGDGLSAFMLDIHARKRAEEGLKLFRALMDSSRESIEVVDPVTARIIDVNEHACLKRGYSREEYLKLTVFDLDPALSPAEFAAVQVRLRASGAVTTEGTHHRKSGERFPVEVSLNWVSLDRDYIVAMVRDISARKLAEGKIHAQLEELRRWHAVTLGREDRILALKREVNELLAAAGAAARYRLEP